MKFRSGKFDFCFIHVPANGIRAPSGYRSHHHPGNPRRINTELTSTEAPNRFQYLLHWPVWECACGLHTPCRGFSCEGARRAAGTLPRLQPRPGLAMHFRKPSNSYVRGPPPTPPSLVFPLYPSSFATAELALVSTIIRDRCVNHPRSRRGRAHGEWRKNGCGCERMRGDARRRRN